MEVVIGLIALIVVFQILKNIWLGIISPKTGSPFTCSNCGRKAQHSGRTVGAWKDGFRRFYCGRCHHLYTQATPTSSSSSGCFGVVVLGAITPATVAIILYCY